MSIQNPKSSPPIQNQVLSLIAAMSENRVIGRNNQLPWRLPADLKRFKALTSGHPVIMGRKTFESINSRPLPQRTNIVITRRRDFPAQGVLVAHDLDEAIGLARRESGSDEIFILGGSEIFQLALPRADRIQLTVIHAHIEGDVFFPEIDSSKWRLAADERHEMDGQNPFAYSFLRYERE